VVLIQCSEKEDTIYLVLWGEKTTGHSPEGENGVALTLVDCVEDRDGSAGRRDQKTLSLGGARNWGPLGLFGKKKRGIGPPVT